MVGWRWSSKKQHDFITNLYGPSSINTASVVKGFAMGNVYPVKMIALRVDKVV